MTDWVQCIVATERNADRILIRPAAGGDALWFGLQGSTSIDGTLQLGQPAAMNVTAAYADNQGEEFFSLVANQLPNCPG